MVNGSWESGHCQRVRKEQKVRDVKTLPDRSVKQVHGARSEQNTKEHPHLLSKVPPHDGGQSGVTPQGL